MQTAKKPRTPARTSSTRIAHPDGSVLHVEPAAGLPLVSMLIGFRLGGTSDPRGKDGLQRFALRLMRRGSRRRSASQLDEAIDAIGAELSVEVGSTSTTLHAQVVSRNLDKLVDLLAEVLHEPAFADDELERLRRESEAELLELRDNDRALANLWFRRTLFGSHPYARSAVGRTASVATFTRDDVLAAYARTMRRSQVVMGLSGDIDVATATEVFARLVEPMSQEPALPLELAEPEPIAGRHLVFVDKPERSQTQVLIGRLGTRADDADHTALGLANTAFGGTFTARLMNEVRSKRGWSYGAYARLAVDQRRHAFSMWTFPAAEQAADCMALEVELLERFVAKGLSKREHRFFQNYLARSYAFDIDTAHKRLSQAVDVDLLGLPADYYSGYLQRIRAVSLEEANEAVARRLDPADLVAVVVGTASTTLEGVRAKLPSFGDARVLRFDQD